MRYFIGYGLGLSLILTPLSAFGQASKAAGCFFEGRALVAMHGCRFLQLDTRGMTVAVQRACRDICDEEARNGVRAAASALKQLVGEGCRSAGDCSQEKLDHSSGCLQSLSKALGLADEIEAESRQSRKCNSGTDLSS